MGRGPTRTIRVGLVCLCAAACGGGEGTSSSAAAGGAQQSSTAGMNAGGAVQFAGTAGTAGNVQSSGQAGVLQGQAGVGQGGSAQSSAQPNCGPGCFPLCQGGICQCECSPIEGCDSAGWQVHTIGWDKFAHPDLTGGVELCMPEDWAPTEPGGVTFGNGQFSFNVYAAVGLDHVHALQGLSDTDIAYCTAQDYEFTIASAGTLPAERWPALMQTYREVPPVCGACPNFVPATELNVVANVSIAYGEYVLQTYASVPESMANADEVIAIGRTARAHSELTPVNTGTEIGALFTQRASLCQ